MTTPINDGGSAFPIPYGQVMSDNGKGMSLRDWFAGQAGETDIRHHQQFVQYDAAYGEKQPPPEPKFTREQARFRYADAMIAARNLQPSK